MTYLVGELASVIRLEGQRQYESDLGRMGQLTSRAWDGIKKGGQGAAQALTAAGVVGTALGVSLFNTGAAYNTLQQTSRAALSTLVGGTEAANEQMAKLDDFARNSPFAKSVFISAQQQLLGFGMEAQKVIPTLDAVQQAVAATGGSSQQLSEITYVLAQVQAAGKITATDLMQLGQRGIDAATLIGSQMGKTGAQIRQDITAGALSAEDALTALTNGMSAKYAGATAGLKQTIEGAKDRIKAATREIGSALAEPFISKTGGGMAVTWGNQVADVLQGVRANTGPLVSIMQGQLAPAFATITRALDAANVTVRSWDSSSFQRFLLDAANNAPALAAVAGGLLGFNSQLLRGIPLVGQFVPAVSPLAGVFTGLALASPELRAALGDVLGALEPLLPAAGDLAGTVSSGLNLVLPVAADVLRTVATAAAPVVETIAAIPAPVVAAVAAFVALRSASGPMGKAVEAALVPITAMAQQVGLQKALSGMSGAAGTAAGAFGAAAVGATTLGNSIKAAFVSNPVGLVLLGLSGVVALLTAAFTAQAEQAKQVKNRIAEYRDTLDEATGKTTDLTRELVVNRAATDGTAEGLKNAGVSLADYADAVMGSADAHARVEQQLKTAMDAQLQANGVADRAKNIADDLGVSYDDVVSALAILPGAYDELSAKMNEQGTEGFRLKTAYDQLRQEVKHGSGQAIRDLSADFARATDEAGQAAVEASKYAASLKDAEKAMTDAERSNSRLNEALTIARDVSRDATERVNALKQALDELKGGAQTQAEATRDLNEQTLRMQSAFDVADENGNKLAASLVSASGAIDTTTTAGIALFDETSRLNDQMLNAIALADKEAKARGQSGVSMQEAAAAAEPYIDKLRTIAQESGLSDEQVNGLIRTMMDTPAMVSFALTDNGTVSESEQRVRELAQALLDTPDADIVINDDDLPAVMQVLAQLGGDIRSIPTGTVRVKKDDGSFGSVSAALADLARDRYATVYTSTVNNVGYGSGKDTGYANGGVEAYADGGFPSGIYAGRPGGIHKFAEPETGWEAYISGRPVARERNKKIAKEAVARLGGVAHFANGGVTAYANGGISQQMRDWMTEQMRDWQTSQRRGESMETGMRGNGLSLVDKLFDIAKNLGGTPGANLEKTALNSEASFLRLAKAAEEADAKLDAISDTTNTQVKDTQARTDAEVKRGQEQLATAKNVATEATKRLSEQQGILSKVSQALQQVADKAASMAASVKSAVRNLFNVSDLGKSTTTSTTRTVRETQNVGGFELVTDRDETVETSTPASASSIASSMAATAARLKRFADKLARLAKMGFPPALVAEIASVGVDNGEPIVDALLTASQAEVASIAASYNAIDTASGRAGQTVSDLNYTDLVREAQRQVDTAQQGVDIAQKQLDTATSAVEAAERNIDAIKDAGEKSIAAIRADGERQIAAAQAAQAALRDKLQAETERIIEAITRGLNKGTSMPVARALGGPIFGAGSDTSDSILLAASNDEHVWSAAEVRGAGGHAAVAQLRRDALRGTLTLAGGPARLGGSESSTVIREGDQHIHLSALPQPGVPLAVQAVRAANRLQLQRRTRVRKP